jgi:hypothetical protein
VRALGQARGRDAGSDGGRGGSAVGVGWRCDAMRCDAPRRRAVLAGALRTGRQRVDGGRGRRGGGSVSQAAHAQNRGQSGQHGQHHRGDEGVAGRRRRGRGQAGRRRAQCGEQMHTRPPNHEDSTKVPTRRPSGSLPARRPAASENQCDARGATAPAPPFPASRVTHDNCVVRALLLAMPSLRSRPRILGLPLLKPRPRRAQARGHDSIHRPRPSASGLARERALAALPALRASANRIHLTHDPLFCHPSVILPVHPSVEALWNAEGAHN